MMARQILVTILFGGDVVKTFKWIFVVFVVVIVMLVGVVAVMGTLAENDLNVLESELRAKGIALEVEELHSTRPEGTVFYSGPPGESATAFLFSAEAAVQGSGVKPSDWMWYEIVNGKRSSLFDSSHDNEKQVIEVVHDNRELIARIRAVAETAPTQMEEVLESMDMRKGLIAAKLPNLQGCRSLCKLLICDAYVAHLEGRPDDALKSCEAALKLAGHIRDMPTLITQMIGIAMSGITLDFFAELLPLTEFSDESFDSFAGVLDESGRREAFALSFEGELLIGRQVFKMISSKTTKSSPSILIDDGGGKMMARVYGSRALSFFRARDEKTHLWIISKYVECARLPYYEQRSIAAEVKEELEGLGWSTPIASLMTPNLLRATASQAEHEVKIDMAKVAIALERYDTQDGYPETLDSLVPDYLPEVPVDEFTGESIVYSLKDDGYLLYSAGENGIDDGASDSSDDIVWGL